jgi:hypothetical protein
LGDGRKVANPMGAMLRQDSRLSVADLCAAGVRLRPIEAVTIVRELSLLVSRGEMPGVPSAHVIRLSPNGTVTIEGPVVAGGRPVPRAAQLLESLLPGFDAPPEFRVPGALRLIVARALGTLDLPPYPSLEAFSDDLSRFAASDPAAVLGDLVTTWSGYVAARQEPAKEVSRGASPEELRSNVWEARQQQGLRAGASALTISDIRRARRATKLTLSEVSARSRIPASLLRQLEWGYLRHWPSGQYGRTQLIRYARASGLDDELVVTTVWPLLEEAVRERGPAPVPILTEDAPSASDVELVKVVSPVPAVVMPIPVRPSRRGRVLAALAIPALVAIALVPAVWQLSFQPTPTPPFPARTVPGSDSRTVPGSDPRTTAANAVRPGSPPVASGPGAGQPHVAQNETVQAEHTARTPKRSAASRVTPSPAVAADSTPGVVAASMEAHPAAGLANGAIAYSPSFATTGTAMFYHAEADGRSALMRADTDPGGAILKITSVVDDRAHNFHARPSPDGSRIAFDSDRDGERGVYIADADGRNVQKVSGDGLAAVPSWSADGGRLAFVRAEPDRPRVWNLWILDLSSRRMERLTSHRVGQPWGGSWFPDGRRIAYSLEDRLVVLDLDRSASRVYRTPKAGRLVRTPAVSPDGRRVIFQVYRDGAWMLELADGSMRKVLSDPSAEEYTWAPDGRRVAYHSRRSGEWGVWLMAAR